MRSSMGRGPSASSLRPWANKAKASVVFAERNFAAAAFPNRRDRGNLEKNTSFRRLNIRMKRAAVALFLSAGLSFPAELPVKEVILYKHGVGFFERAGRLAAGESTRLDFDAS